MSNFFETAMAVQLGIMMSQNQTSERVHPSEYDPEDLIPNIDPDLPPDQYMKELTEFLCKPLLTKEQKRFHRHHH